MSHRHHDPVVAALEDLQAHIEDFKDRSLRNQNQIENRLGRLERLGQEILMALSENILALLQRISDSVTALEDFVTNGGGGSSDAELVEALTPLVDGLAAVVAALTGGGGTGGGTTIPVTGASWDEERRALRHASFAGFQFAEGATFDLQSGSATPGVYGVESASGDEITLMQSIGAPTGTSDISGTLSGGGGVPAAFGGGVPARTQFGARAQFGTQTRGAGYAGQGTYPGSQGNYPGNYPGGARYPR